MVKPEQSHSSEVLRRVVTLEAKLKASKHNQPIPLALGLCRFGTTYSLPLRRDHAAQRLSGHEQAPQLGEKRQRRLVQILDQQFVAECAHSTQRTQVTGPPDVTVRRAEGTAGTSWQPTRIGNTDAWLHSIAMHTCDARPLGVCSPFACMHTSSDVILNVHSIAATRK